MIDGKSSRTLRKLKNAFFLAQVKTLTSLIRTLCFERVGNKGRPAESYSINVHLLRAVVSRARRSVVHPRDDAANSIITIWRGVHEPYKKYNTCALATLYVYHRRPAHRRANRAPSLLAPRSAAQFPPPSPPYATNCTLRGASVELGRRKSDSAVSHENIPLYITASYSSRKVPKCQVEGF